LEWRREVERPVGFSAKCGRGKSFGYPIGVYDICRLGGFAVFLLHDQELEKVCCQLFVLRGGADVRNGMCLDFAEVADYDQMGSRG
jgi:hypothetical protein